MLIELRASDDRLRGPKAVDAAPLLTSAYRAVASTPTDLSRLRVVCDFIQYRQNFRDAVELRRVEPWDIDAATPEADGQSWEIAIDLRRAKPEVIEASIKESFADGTDCARLPLEAWGPGSRSLIWGFNSLYWKALSLWEQATGKGYESALPGGQSDARNVEAARELILKLFTLWDNLDARRALPEELYVLELGVVNGNQARVWLDEFLRMDRERGSDYYRAIAKKGGTANMLKYGTEHFSEMGKKGGKTTKERQDPDFYSRIGKLGGSARRQKKVEVE